MYDKADPLFARAITIGEKALGLEHPDLSLWLANRAELLIGQVIPRENPRTSSRRTLPIGSANSSEKMSQSSVRRAMTLRLSCLTSARKVSREGTRSLGWCIVDPHKLSSPCPHSHRGLFPLLEELRQTLGFFGLLSFATKHPTLTTQGLPQSSITGREC